MFDNDWGWLMYQIQIEKNFSASHAIALPDGSLEPLHGHNWPVVVTVQSQELDEIHLDLACVLIFIHKNIFKIF